MKLTFAITLAFIGLFASTLINAAPSIDNANGVCTFAIDGINETGPLDCDITVNGTEGPGMQVTGRFYDEYTGTVPPRFTALYGNQSGPCFYLATDGITVYFTSNVITTIVNQQQVAGRVQFFMSCSNMQPVPF